MRHKHTTEQEPSSIADQMPEQLFAFERLNRTLVFVNFPLPIHDTWSLKTRPLLLGITSNVPVILPRARTSLKTRKIERISRIAYVCPISVGRARDPGTIGICAG